MPLSNETVVAIIALLVMCIPGLQYLMRFIRRHNTQPPPYNNMLVPAELISVHDDPISLEGGMLYARRTVSVDTVMIRPAVPSFNWAFRRRGSELDPPHHN
ncbi:hypothetical protein F4821DRAFT_249853 [Hypoxylon rubiginosum]|uniref:Uncharacterized protein n=1 Tax=Hypoxylon rubiginosum TaxID=110542 RepID=A0ACC0CLD0_9PEZI|nr:hypothetical protein F4821DRAFT_249853 [Hypoxylon rubiginosum]